MGILFNIGTSIYAFIMTYNATKDTTFELKTADQFGQMLDQHADILFETDVYLLKFGIFFTITYAILSFSCLVVTTYTFFATANQMNTDIRNKILKRYWIYFVVLNIMELPHIVTVLLVYNNYTDFNDYKFVKRIKDE